MDHKYHVQREVTTYYRHIPHVPEHFTVNPLLLSGMSEKDFVMSFRQFTGIMGRMYRDMELRPEAYGVMIVDINLVNENKEDGNLAKASWRSVKRLGDVIAAIGKLGESAVCGLKITVADFKTALKKVNKVHLILSRLMDFGFTIGGFDGDKIAKHAESIVITFPDNPLLMTVIKAYALTDSFQGNDPHEFYYFDYKRVAERAKLPEYCTVRDLAALLDENNGELLLALNSYFADQIKLAAHYKDDTIEYYLKNKRVARYIIDFHTLEVQVILKLKNMDNYLDLVQSLPPGLRCYFERDGCHYCGFQNATVDWCKFRLSWTLDGRRRNACSFESFNFNQPRSEDAEPMMKLMMREYQIPG
ncbi:hypothetical protein DFP94_101567 [Fontibacillus phaseoli]|uniref:Uncharacterized protein n=1 Tax=Fontibacillus phaseoli TaxID=1416533 RepID=A0A369BR90_9BACL|nr:hypothetical protein [Fontibacillus phaseoli]RCX22977.1 hypothetical protein DFP94_101567 [Fontibacillus phaseoli]